MFRRSRWKDMMIPATALVLGLVTWYLLPGNSQHAPLRIAYGPKEFVSALDAQGYRYRFTLASGWKCEEDVFLGLDTGPPVDFVITPTSTSPRYLKDRPQLQPPSVGASIYLRASSLARDTRFQIVHGYPEWKFVQAIQHEPFPTKMLLHKHFRIDGYPASGLEWEVFDGHRTIQVTSVAVYVPAHSTIYTGDVSYDPMNADQYNHEIQAILSSFHIEAAKANRQ